MGKKVLELFAGSRSFGKEAEKLGMEVFSIDWKPYEGINLTMDIEDLNENVLPWVPDIVWASPDCTTYSIAAAFFHRINVKTPITEYAIKCDRVNWHFITFIRDYLLKLNPNLLFFIENPVGLYRKQKFVRPLIRRTVWYFQYGDFRAKPTDIFTNCIDWKPRKVCFNGNLNCHHEKSPRGASNSGTCRLNGSYNRSIIPAELCKEILEACNG
jgi:site-specific DNA-cytosine methylase